MDLLEKYINYIKKENLFQPKDHLLLAVSGGLDSVGLCELCKQAGYDFSIAHFNFYLRGKESQRQQKNLKNTEPQPYLNPFLYCPCLFCHCLDYIDVDQFRNFQSLSLLAHFHGFNFEFYFPTPTLFY